MGGVGAPSRGSRSSYEALNAEKLPARGQVPALPVLPAADVRAEAAGGCSEAWPGMGLAGATRAPPRPDPSPHWDGRPRSHGRTGNASRSSPTASFLCSEETRVSVLLSGLIFGPVDEARSYHGPAPSLAAAVGIYHPFQPIPRQSGIFLRKMEELQAFSAPSPVSLVDQDLSHLTLKNTGFFFRQTSGFPVQSIDIEGVQGDLSVKV